MYDRSLLPYGRPLLTLAGYAGDMQQLMQANAGLRRASISVGLLCVYDRSLLPYGGPLLTLAGYPGDESY